MKNKQRFAYLKIMSAFLVIISLMAFVMRYNAEAPRALAWVYQWGDSTASLICIILLITGYVGYRFADKKQREPDE